MLDPILHGLLAMAQAAAPAPAPQTPQAQFDAANTAYAEQRCADALRLYDALERRTAGSSNAVLVGAIAVRKGICLVRTGDSTTGVAAIRRGLPTLAKNPDEFAADLGAGYLALGNVSFDALDYDAATASYRDALALAKGVGRVLPLLALSRTLAFDHDGKALVYADEARRLVEADPTVRKETVAAVQTRYARVLLNEGRTADAYTVLKDSLKKQGGLDSRVSQSEVATRADLAQAALLNGDREKARTYLAYTGAGRLEKAPFAGARQMDSAPCGAATGLKPTDMAVVEFALGDDGIVRSVAPVYTTGNRAVALAFARSVADWSWSPDDARAIPAFWRQSARVELRCSTAAERPSVRLPLDEAVDAWLTAHGSPAPAWADLPAARALPLAQAEAVRARAAGDRPGQMRVLLWLSDSQLLTDKERRPLAAEALAAGQAANAPVAVMTRLRLEDSWVNGRDYADAARRRHGLLDRPELTADPLSAATVRMLIATETGVTSAADRARMIDAVLASPLPDRHPLKVAALLARADLSAQRGDVAGAQAAFRRTGLTSDQCALIAPTPAVQRQGATSDLYPAEALNMGFEGWAKIEFDIAADGRTLTPRTIAAYPPFVFGDAAQKMVAATRFRSSFRPDNDTACTGNATRINFQLPR
ncbi:energy transducer TonB [Sphingomonas sp. 2R-10]|uniref:energy transducer TonB n=1 Tax=Sphingomonas sp. 2R-10 TaxID=3045148 RepID=UPI000F7ABE07|nr:energy transducer TonB [Sphingomonas sp. 2R-10]MDJ0278374.1 energy transducer TonB [Sphingomonas sp. 2R-10]